MNDSYCIDDAVPPNGGTVNNILIGKRPKGTYACALIAYIKNEEGSDIVENIFDRAVAGDAVVYMSAVNLSEVIYNFRPEKTENEMNVLWQRIHNLPITIVREITDNTIDTAAFLKSRSKMSLADSFGLAVAKELGAAFVTSDHSELKPVSQHEPISFLWLPPRPKK
ncbi:hypothetical protein AGMMS49991_02810 [Spirochaetia bacterium]|nr:hypothetical protein AGMMS49991_02810 [Spirochaetia bacterium]